MSIITLSKKYHADVIKLFKDEVDHYQFLINDLLRYNYSDASFHVYGEYEDGELVSILLNNFDNVTYYSSTDRDVSVYLEILNDLNFSKLSGPGELMVKFLPFIHVKRDTISYMGVVKSITAKRRYPEMEIQMVQSERDLVMLYELFASVEEYRGILPGSKEEFVREESNRLKQQNDCRTAFLSLHNEMAATAATVREYETSAIIVGVCTNKSYRNKGYATEVLVGLFEELLEEGKYPYLFYTNPNARRVYKNSGMEEVCEWRVINI